MSEMFNNWFQTLVGVYPSRFTPTGKIKNPILSFNLLSAVHRFPTLFMIWDKFSSVFLSRLTWLMNHVFRKLIMRELITHSSMQLVQIRVGNPPFGRMGIKTESPAFVAETPTVGVLRGWRHLIGGCGDIHKCPNTTSEIANELREWTANKKSAKLL